MTDPDQSEDEIDWSLTTWEGARREQLRRWRKLPLESIIASLEEMQALTEMLQSTPPADVPQSTSSALSHDPATEDSKAPYSSGDEQSER